MEHDSPREDFAPIFEYLDADGATHEVVVLRPGLVADTPEGFKATLEKYQHGGLLEWYAAHGLTLTDRVAHSTEDQAQLRRTLQIGGRQLEVVYLSGPTFDAWHLLQRVEAQLQRAHDQQGDSPALN